METLLEKKTTINLDHLEQTSAYKADELIYREERDVWAKRIRQDLKTNLNAPKESDTQSQVLAKQPTYYIGGGRGSGKSTFLRALIDLLQKPEDQEDKKTAIMHLTTVDPTTLGSGENFFIYILSTFYEKIKSIHKDAKPWAQQSKGQLDLRKQLNELMEELTLAVKNLTNSKTSHLETIDDSWVYQDSMKLGMSSMKLRDNFRELVEKTCQFCHCDALLIGIDDADINCSKSADVLEYLRKYMITPQLIFIFAGDMHLQEQVVRGMQLSNFNKDSFALDKALNHIRLGLIDQMQEQYLLKLFPLTNRYTLQNLRKEQLQNIKLTLDNTPSQESCLEFLQRIVAPHIGPGSSIQTALINMPKRTFFQLMRYCMIHKEKDRYVVDGLRQVANYAIAKHGIPAYEIEQGSVSALSRGVINVVRKDDDMMSAAALIPVREDELNRAFLYLSAEISETAQKHYKGLEFLLSTYSYFQLHKRFMENGNQQSQEEAFQRYADSTFNGDYLLWGKRMTAAMAHLAPSGSAKVKQFRNGCIRIMKRPKEKGWRRLDAIENKILNSYREEQEQGASSPDLLRYYIALKNAISAVTYNNVSALCISIYNLLGCLQQCISALLTAPEPGEALHKILHPGSEYPSEESPFSTSSTPTDDDDDDNSDDVPSESPKDIQPEEIWLIVDEIIEWWNKYKDKKVTEKHYAPNFSKCWKRFSNSLTWRADDITLSLEPENGKSKRANKKQEEELPLKNSKGDPIHYVAETLDCFMKAFTDALRVNLGAEYASFVEDFPLWKALSPQQADSAGYKEARKLLNKVYAGQQKSTKKTPAKKPAAKRTAPATKVTAEPTATQQAPAAAAKADSPPSSPEPTNLKKTPRKKTES